MEFHLTSNVVQMFRSFISHQVWKRIWLGKNSVVSDINWIFEIILQRHRNIEIVAPLNKHSDKNKNAFSQNFSTNNRKINSHFSSLNENKESQICPMCDGTIWFLLDLLSWRILRRHAIRFVEVLEFATIVYSIYSLRNC